MIQNARGAMIFNQNIMSDYDGPDSQFQKNNDHRGATLVELLIAMVILALVSICTLCYFQFGSSVIHQEGNRRAAFEIARSRLEQLFQANFSSIKPPDTGVRWLTCSGTPCVWTLSEGTTSESVSVNGVSGRLMRTTVQWFDDPAAAGTQNGLLLSAKVWYRGDTADSDLNRVELRSLRAP